MNAVNTYVMKKRTAVTGALTFHVESSIAGCHHRNITSRS